MTKIDVELLRSEFFYTTGCSPAGRLILGRLRECFVYLLVRNFGDIPVFHFFSGPGCFTEKLEAGADRWIIEKAADRDPAPHGLPSVLFNELSDSVFECDPV
jgi:hypothetical protein